MIQFKLAPHRVNSSVSVVEIWSDSTLMGVIYPDDDRIRVIGKNVKGGKAHTDGVNVHEVLFDMAVKSN